MTVCAPPPPCRPTLCYLACQSDLWVSVFGLRRFRKSISVGYVGHHKLCAFFVVVIMCPLSMSRRQCSRPATDLPCNEDKHVPHGLLHFWA